jgi:hypothetical protein
VDGRPDAYDQDDARAEVADDGLGALPLDALVALGDAFDLRVRYGTATLEDFGGLARTRRELARRAEAGRRARSRGAGEPG